VKAFFLRNFIFLKNHHAWMAACICSRRRKPAVGRPQHGFNALIRIRRDPWGALPPHFFALNQKGAASKTLRSGGITTQLGRLRVKIATVGRKDDGSSKEPA